jgi:hypothetical protein
MDELVEWADAYEGGVLGLGLWDPLAIPSIRAGTSVRTLECLARALANARRVPCFGPTFHRTKRTFSTLVLSLATSHSRLSSTTNLRMLA